MTWKTTEFWTPGTKNRSYLERRPPGKVIYPAYSRKREAKLTSMRLRHDAIEQMFPEEGSVIFYFKRGKYREIATD